MSFYPDVVDLTGCDSDGDNVEARAREPPLPRAVIAPVLPPVPPMAPRAMTVSPAMAPGVFGGQGRSLPNKLQNQKRKADRKFQRDVLQPGYNKLLTEEMGGRFVLSTTESPYMMPGVTNNTFNVSVGGDFSGSLLGAVTNSTNTNSHNTNTNSHNTNTNSHNTGVGAGTVRASKAGYRRRTTSYCRSPTVAPLPHRSLIRRSNNAATNHRPFHGDLDCKQTRRRHEHRVNFHALNVQ
jgi:hypothetical protein